jgi:hypothetical protein
MAADDDNNLTEDRLLGLRVVDVIGQPSKPETHWYEDQAH